MFDRPPLLEEPLAQTLSRKIAWQKAKICMAETQKPRSRKQTSAWQNKHKHGRKQNRRGRICGRESGMAVPAAAHCHVRRGGVADRSATPLPRATPAHVQCMASPSDFPPRKFLFSARQMIAFCHADCHAMRRRC